MTGRLLRRLRQREEGASALEFALIALPLFSLIIGFFEFAIMTLTGSVLESAALEAARFGATGTVPGGMTREERMLQIVEDRTYGLVDMDKLEIDTLVYTGFDKIGQPESYDDANGNGQFDDGEDYQDVNGNGSWDADQGRTGLGAADEIVVYRLDYPWQPLTPFMAPITEGSVLSSSIPVRNEPF